MKHHGFSDDKTEAMNRVQEQRCGRGFFIHNNKEEVYLSTSRSQSPAMAKGASERIAPLSSGDSLPHEILCAILSGLSLSTRSVTRMVSRTWSAASFPSSATSPLKGIALWRALAGEGSLALMRWLAKGHRPWEVTDWRSLDERLRYRAYLRVVSLAQVAAHHGNRDVIEWLDEQDFAWQKDYPRMTQNVQVLVEAAGGGQCKLAEWLLDLGCPLDEAESIVAAAKGGHLETLRYLYDRNPRQRRLTKEAFQTAAQGGHLDVLIWLRDRGCSWDWNACLAAAREGHLAVLQWLSDPLWCSPDHTWAWAAAKGGQLKVLQWLQENSLVLDVWTCASAAEAGHLEVLQWLRDNGCPWNHYTPFRAAAEGHLDCLAWALQNGCEWNENECAYQARYEGCSEVVAWISERRNCRQTGREPDSHVEPLSSVLMRDVYVSPRMVIDE